MPTFEITSPDGKQYEVTGPEGSTKEQALERVKSQHAAASSPGLGGTLLDVGKSFGVGVAKGAESFPGAMASMLGAAGRGVESLGFGNQEEAAKREQFRKENPRQMLTDKLPKPTTTAGKYAESVGEFGPATLASPGGAVGRAVSAVGGGMGSEAAGQLTEGTGAEPYARIVGGVAGGVLPSAAARTITPLPANARHAANVATLEHEGVTGLTAGERTGYRPLRYMEEHIGGSPTAGRAAEEAIDRPREQFTRAALERIGEHADRATPEVIDRAHTRIGNEFDRLSAASDSRIDQHYVNDILQAQSEYDHLFVDPLKKPMVDNVIDHAMNKLARSGTMTGEEYKAVRSRVERMRRGQKQDPELSGFLASVRDAMDNLIERNLVARNSPDVGAWRDVRNQYRNLLVIDRATTGAETGGLITPSKLKQGAVGQNRTAYARGQGDFAELARAGENVMPGLPQSGTAPRLLSEGGVTKLVTTGLAGRALMSPLAQGYLGNQLMAGVMQDLPSAQAALLRSILANSSSPLAAGGP